jgi:hypothetical protein
MRYCYVCYRETLHVPYAREKPMWDQCAGAHEIDGIRAKEIFLPYGMGVDGCRGFLLPLICLLTWAWDPSM